MACAKAPKPAPVATAPVGSAPRLDERGLPVGFAESFAAADARARAVVFWQQCSSNVLRLRAGGTFGAAARAPRNVHCERTADGVPVGGVFDTDTGFTTARRLILVRLDGSRPRYTEIVDTQRVAQAARLVRDVTRELTRDAAKANAALPAARRVTRPFTVVPVVSPYGVLEAWAIPVSTQGARTAVQGGDIAVVRAAGGALQRIVDHSATWKVITIPAAGAIRVTSSERETAAVSDIAIARAYTELGRDVTLVTAVATSRLLPGVDVTGSRFRWQHTPTRTEPAAPGK